MLKILLTFLIILLYTFSIKAQTDSYVSPYSINYKYSKTDLIDDLLNTGRGDFKNCSDVPYDQWYSEKTKKKYGSWGPRAKQYSYPEIISGKDADYIPLWDPPPDFPWSKTSAGANGKGFDCSDFTSFVYNIAMGIKLNTGIRKQSEDLDISKRSNGKFESITKLENPESYDDFKKTFLPGDLLFIKNNKGEIAHVVIWLGDMGISGDNTPLILDSHGDVVKDSNGNIIPCGPHIRPFRENSWYYNSFSHGVRIISN